jgi:RHS repeat-associated protein
MTDGLANTYHFAENIWQFTGKERDLESGLDYFLARYYASSYGKFLQPDPITSNVLRIVNPQRLNLYSYAANNPLTYFDPDGRDAIAVNLVGQVPLGGHSGIIVVRADGSATYARFGPRGGSKPFGPGEVQVHTLDPVEFGASGLPTDAAYQKLAQEVAAIEGEPPSTVGFNYFKTSEADTIALDNWIKQMKQLSDRGKAPEYQFNMQNCAAFCIAGLLVANAIQNRNISLIPNRLFVLLSGVAEESWTWEGKRLGEKNKLKEVVTHRICKSYENGVCK